MNCSTTLQHALSYASRGWHVFPVHGITDQGTCTCENSGCGSPGKHPWTPKGFKDASVAPNVIRNLFASRPGANIGIRTGAVSKLLVVDWDPRNGGERPETLPETAEVLTGGGGGHLYFAIDGPVASKSGVRKGIDIKADSGYVVAPPSRHASGRSYEWELSHHFEEVPLADAPSEVLAYLQRTQDASSSTDGRTYRRGQRNEFLMSLAGSMRRKGLDLKLIRQSLTTINAQCCLPPLEEKEVFAIAKSVTRYDPQRVPPELIPLLLRASDADETPIEWLWDLRMPLGCMVGLEGDPGLGKSTVTTRIAAAVTRGKPLPDSTTPSGEPANVLFMNAEDDPGRVMKPRLREAGADLSRVHFILGLISSDSEEQEPEHPITLIDLDKLEETMDQYKPKLLVIDPLQAYFPSDRDMHRANETRSVLEYLNRLLRKHDACALVIRHLSKSSTGQSGVYRGLGSMDISGALRSILALSNHPEDVDDEGRRVLVQPKSNYGPHANTIGFSLGEHGFQWDGVCLLIRESHVRASAEAKPKKPSGGRAYLEDAVAWLNKELKEGPKSRGELLKESPYGEGTIKRAADVLGVIRTRPTKVGQQGIWHLPDPDSPKDTPSGPTDENSEKPRETPSGQPSENEVSGPTETGSGLTLDEDPENPDSSSPGVSLSA